MNYTIEPHHSSCLIIMLGIRDTIQNVESNSPGLSIYLSWNGEDLKSQTNRAILLLPCILDREAYSRENTQSFVEIHIRMSRRWALPIESCARCPAAVPENACIRRELLDYFRGKTKISNSVARNQDLRRHYSPRKQSFCFFVLRYTLF